MRANSFLVATILATTLSLTGYAADSSAILSQAQEFIKQKDYSAAKGLLARQLKIDRNSYKLWLALGYVYEADNDYEQALKAFMRASELQTGIDGLATRITRLQELVKSQPKKAAADSTDAAAKARELLNTARYKHSFKDFLESYKIFVEAVELDRSILAHDYGFIENGLKYFNENANKPEYQFYLGAYNFYAGLYPKADDMLSDYIREYPQGQYVETAKSLLQECRDVVAQAKAAEAAETVALAAAEADKARAVSQDKDRTKDQTQSVAVGDKPYVVAIDNPEFSTEQPYQESSDGGSLEMAEARTRVISLLSDYERETDAETKHGILWRIGVIQQPFPEVIEKFSGLMAEGDIETIYATLEALDKIGLPGAENCVGDLYRLLDHNDLRVSFRAIQSFRRMPMQGAKVIPKLFNIYQNENHAIRKNLVVMAFKSYGEDGVAILNAMIKAAPGPNKRPIAEIISILTGESVEDIISNS
jgi:tetratricopeptide (TPR) repeat protein